MITQGATLVFINAMLTRHYIWISDLLIASYYYGMSDNRAISHAASYDDPGNRLMLSSIE